ncbi:hypothetical protein ACQPU1_17815 [Clostridium paraputrificum]
MKSIADLKNTDNFRNSALEGIIRQITKRDDADLYNKIISNVKR